MKVMEITDALKKMHHDRGMRSVVLNAPVHILQELEREGFTERTGTTLKNEFTLVFASHRKDIDTFVPLALESTRIGGPLWVACPRSGRGLDREQLLIEMRRYDYEPLASVTLDADWEAVRFRPAGLVTVKTPDDESDTLKPPSW